MSNADQQQFENNEDTPTGSEDSDGAIEELLAAHQQALRKQAFYEKAGRLAWSISTLRSRQREVDFELVPFREWVERLAAPVGVDLQPVLGWFGLNALSFQDSLPSLARFGRHLGCTCDQLSAQLALGHLFEINAPVPALSRTARTPTAMTPLTFLDSIAGLHISDGERDQLNDLLSVLRIEYERQGLGS